jgi:hypothetical protein
MSRFLKYLLWLAIGLIVLQGIVARDNGPLTAIFGNNGVYYLLLGDVVVPGSIVVLIYIEKIMKLDRRQRKYIEMKATKEMKADDFARYIAEMNAEDK